MSRVLWACWDGGGNLPPSLGIAAELRERGHDVVFHGRPEMVDRVVAAGGEAHALTTARTDLDRYSFHPLPTVFGYTGSPAVGQELVEIINRDKPDVVVIDAMFSTALDRAPDFDAPTVVMVHTMVRRQPETWRGVIAMQSDSRVRAGFTATEGIDILWGSRDLVHANTLASLDSGPELVPNLTHGAPVLTSDSRARSSEIPWQSTDSVPIVLLSFSTVPEQRDVDALQRALDALADLPVRVVGTTAGVVAVDELTVPANAHLFEFADHEQLLARASMVVGHGGHGTTMRALRAGTPLVVIPARGADQAGMSAFVEESHFGRGLTFGADTPAIRDAVREVLNDETFAEAIGPTSRELSHANGATLAADSVERAMR